MPGKYSHSVVLADYSSRGIIILPPDQHTKYVKSAPTKRGTSASSQRLRGTKSTQTMYRAPSSVRADWDLPLPDRPHPSLSTNVTPIRARVNVLVEEDESEPRPLRYSGYYEQMPHSTPAINVASQLDSGSAYQRQQLRNGTGSSQQGVPLQVNDRSNHSSSRSAFLTPEEQLVHPAIRNSNPNVGLRIDNNTILGQQRFSFLRSEDSNRTSSSDTLAGHSNSASRKTSTPEPGASNQHANSREVNSRNFLGDGGNRGAHTSLDKQRSSREPESQRRKEFPRQNFEDQAPIIPTKARPVATETAKSNSAKQSKVIQMLNPSAGTDAEPNFDGFSDRDVVPGSYFEVPKQTSSHHRDLSASFNLPIQRPDSHNGTGAQGQQTNITPTAASQMSSKLKDRDIPSRTTATSTVESSRRQMSASSVSSTSAPDGKSQQAPRSKNESSIISTNTSILDQRWGLPEIEEDNGFSPSIFEDREGGSQGYHFEDFDMMGSIGQISSGKDVSIDDDAASELSAALPPPISRFKDEEDEFNANMVKLFGEGAEVIAPKKSSHGFGRWPTAKSKGFFSKFKSKS